METGYTRHPQGIITGIRTDLIRILVRMKMAQLVFRRYKNPLHCINIFRKLAIHRREISGEKIRKMVLVDGKYYWDLYVPGFKSKALNNFFEGEANRISPSGLKTTRFTNVLVAITKKCPLKCEHCFEWDALNERETLTLDDIKEIVRKFQERGTGQIQITGGEPLMNVDDVVTILSSSKPGTEFWIFTSGYNLTLENATKLKKAGLTGVVVSLDHFDPGHHNRFRGSSKSFDWVQTAVKNATEVKLVTALSLCVTASFASESNLITYAELAKKMGVSFIQVLEPRATGHYSGKEVTLGAGQLKILEDFYLKMNYDKQYRDYPIICFHGYYQRRVGCFGSGGRSLYVDTDGDLHACPFCRTKMGNAISEDLDHVIEQLVAAGCHQFKASKF
jgi:MoaA/NifB/PqqE/SkfB family radical SAM enzyme